MVDDMYAVGQFLFQRNWPEQHNYYLYKDNYLKKGCTFLKYWSEMIPLQYNIQRFHGFLDIFTRSANACIWHYISNI